MLLEEGVEYDLVCTQSETKGICSSTGKCPLSQRRIRTLLVVSLRPGRTRSKNMATQGTEENEVSSDAPPRTDGLMPSVSNMDDLTLGKQILIAIQER